MTPRHTLKLIVPFACLLGTALSIAVAVAAAL